MRPPVLALLAVACSALTGCGKAVLAAPQPELAPIVSPLLQRPAGEAEGEVGRELQVQREQARRNGEHSRVGAPSPQGNG